MYSTRGAGAQISLDSNLLVLLVAESRRGVYKTLSCCELLGGFFHSAFRILLGARWTNILRQSLGRGIAGAREENPKKLGLSGGRWNEESTAGTVCMHL